MSVNKNPKGIILIEVLVAISVITIGLVYLLGTYSFSLKISGSKKEFYRANLIAQECLEGVRNFRDNTNWSEDGLGTFTTSTPYHLEKTGPPLEWTLVSGEETIDGFTRRIVFDDVGRDSDGNIMEDGGIFDPDTKKIIANVSWQYKGKPYQIELGNFFTNWK